MTTMATVSGRVPAWTLADRLRKARLECELTQAEFAAKIGVQAAAYQQWEADNNKPRDVVAIARRIEEVTGISAAWILGLTTPPERESITGCLPADTGSIIPFPVRQGLILPTLRRTG